jgi:hypothetical protein
MHLQTAAQLVLSFRVPKSNYNAWRDAGTGPRKLDAVAVQHHVEHRVEELVALQQVGNKLAFEKAAGAVLDEFEDLPSTFARFETLIEQLWRKFPKTPRAPCPPGTTRHHRTGRCSKKSGYRSS